jgi:peptidoglycan/xylan/chitin deacetylase (PgdA/CDA1 family)
MRRPGSHRKQKAREHVIVHRDVRSKALVLLLVFVLAMAVLYIADSLPPRQVAQRRGVVSALETGRDKAGAARDVKPVEVRGLDYQVPRAKKAASGSRPALERALQSGLLKGYSAPAGMVAFKPDGGVVLIPPSSPVTGPRDPTVIFHGTRGKRRVALTFDTSEVAEPETARAIIDRLTDLRAPATFFVCGSWCYRNPDLLRAAVARGFEIASHSYGHPAFTGLTDERIASELKGTEEAVSKVSGAKIAAYFRPPYGAFDDRVVQLAAQQGYATVLWDRDTVDWGASTIQEEIRDRATVGVQGGDIVLMHTTGRFTSEALIEIVNNLRADGFELTTLTGVMQP